MSFPALERHFEPGAATKVVASRDGVVAIAWVGQFNIGVNGSPKALSAQGVECTVHGPWLPFSARRPVEDSSAP